MEQYCARTGALDKRDTPNVSIGITPNNAGRSVLVDLFWKRRKNIQRAVLRSVRPSIPGGVTPTKDIRLEISPKSEGAKWTSSLRKHITSYFWIKLGRIYLIKYWDWSSNVKPNRSSWVVLFFELVLVHAQFQTYLNQHLARDTNHWESLTHREKDTDVVHYSFLQSQFYRVTNEKDRNRDLEMLPALYNRNINA